MQLSMNTITQASSLTACGRHHGENPPIAGAAIVPLEFLERLTEPRLRPVPTRFGRRRTRTGFVARRSAEDLAPFRALENAVRDAAQEPSRGPTE